MWIYYQDSGELAHDGEPVAIGYSGHGEGKNNPYLQGAANLGPIPCGMYDIGPPHDTVAHGPFVLTLTPCDPALMYGRAGFLMHGDSREHPGEASHGCIIMSRPVRGLVALSNDKKLLVIAERCSGPNKFIMEDRDNVQTMPK